MTDKIQLYEDQPIRTAWVEDEEEWYFSVVDVVRILTEQPDTDGARNYWKVLKKRLKDDGNQSVTNCNQLKLKSPKDGKRYKTDVANTEQILRVIQSIPSPKAEPFKMWLAQVGRERIEETIDPELTIDRALETYAKLGYDADWINQRLQTIRARKELTDQWKGHGVKQGKEFAILTDEVTRAWSGMSTRQYKDLKGLNGTRHWGWSLYNLTAQAFYFQVEWENSLTTGLTRRAGVLLHNPKQTDALCCATCPMKAADYKSFCT